MLLTAKEAREKSEIVANIEDSEYLKLLINLINNEIKNGGFFVTITVSIDDGCEHYDAVHDYLIGKGYDVSSVPSGLYFIEYEISWR